MLPGCYSRNCWTGWRQDCAGLLERPNLGVTLPVLLLSPVRNTGTVVPLVDCCPGASAGIVGVGGAWTVPVCPSGAVWGPSGVVVTFTRPPVDGAAAGIVTQRLGVMHRFLGSTHLCKCISQELEALGLCCLPQRRCLRAIGSGCDIHASAG